MDFSNIFYNNWADLVRTGVVSVVAYAALVALLRVSGKRTLSKMNAFDLVVTVALGSTLATILLSKDVALAEGVLAFAMLIGLQFGVAWLSVRSQAFSRLVKSEPRLLVYHGEILPGALRAERVAEEEVLSAIRQEGMAALDKVEAVVLETDGSFTVIPQSATTSAAALNKLAGYRDRATA